MAIKTYKLPEDAKVFCSPHTQVYEMASKDGSKTVLIDTALMDMVEKLFAKLNCSKYIITSGYRTPEHSVKVGGSRTDRHTQGKALDARFYDKDGNVIPAQIVCCVAQDLGFNGIANISKNYQAVHLDMGDRAKQYLGDETKGTNSVTRNFYEYFGIAKADVAKYTGEAIEPKCYPKYEGTSYRIDEVFSAIGVPAEYTGSWRKRSAIAKANSINGYQGSASQNTQLINLAKQGFLRKP